MSLKKRQFGLGVKSLEQDNLSCNPAPKAEDEEINLGPFTLHSLGKKGMTSHFQKCWNWLDVSM